MAKAGANTLSSELHKLINSTWNEKEFHQQWNETTILPICKDEDKTGCSSYRVISRLQLHTELYPYLF
jgi:hypothetical protein